jgi:glycosyltransferase involved in cell wall biosynthesis
LQIFTSPSLVRIRQIWRILPDDAPAHAKLPGRMIEVWDERPDLQRAFDLSTEEGRIGTFWWFYMHGFVEMGLYPDPQNDGATWVNSPVPGIPRHGLLPITWLMREIWKRSGSYRRRALKAREEQHQFLTEFFTTGLTDRYLDGFLTAEQARVLLGCSDDLPGVPRICEWIFEKDADARTNYGHASNPDFLAWCRTDGARRYPILAHPLIGLASPERLSISRPHGVNIVGYANVRLGIAEDMRMAAQSLAAAGIPFSLYNVSAGPAITEHAEDGQFPLSDELPYDTNLFCMTGMGTITSILAHREKFAGHRNIGVWPWELPAWPAFWHHAYDFVDEVWAASEFTAGAFRASSPKPVRHVPVAVTVKETELSDRADFQLPPTDFLFAFSFDALSAFARKNPTAVVAAFKQAFSGGDRKVGLVLKGMRAEGSPEWQELLDLIGDDPRIHIVTESMSRGRMLDLYRSIDCFVSLHRSEGLGRNILECMALGKPVIVTGYSGNMDFTTTATAALVGFRPIQVAAGEYPFGAGQIWADPSVEEAATLMQRMVDDADWRQSIAHAGQAFVSQRYSPQAVGNDWRQLLRPNG